MIGKMNWNLFAVPGDVKQPVHADIMLTIFLVYRHTDCNFFSPVLRDLEVSLCHGYDYNFYFFYM